MENHFPYVFFVDEVFPTKRAVLLADGPVLQAMQVKEVAFVAVEFNYIAVRLEKLDADSTLLLFLI